MHSIWVFSIHGEFLSSFLYVLSTTPKAVDVFSVDELGKTVHIQRFNYIAYAESVGIKLGKWSIGMLYGDSLKHFVLLDSNYLAGMGIFTWKQ